eukprot:TRINITY_DN4630_c0_g4_i1.p1 TRINITY_DN4630_c0_g4~~TRINITY_DN4630_c0_g4_i1.p1  ORF type:complete len:310 (-),score=-33.39 TRINITY_DN4630_c0_g4_i1:852-1781(-)
MEYNLQQSEGNSKVCFFNFFFVFFFFFFFTWKIQAIYYKQYLHFYSTLFLNYKLDPYYLNCCQFIKCQFITVCSVLQQFVRTIIYTFVVFINFIQIQLEQNIENLFPIKSVINIHHYFNFSITYQFQQYIQYLFSIQSVINTHHVNKLNLQIILKVADVLRQACFNITSQNQFNQSLKNGHQILLQLMQTLIYQKDEVFLKKKPLKFDKFYRQKPTDIPKLSPKKASLKPEIQQYHQHKLYSVSQYPQYAQSIYCQLICIIHKIHLNKHPPFFKKNPSHRPTLLYNHLRKLRQRAHGIVLNSFFYLPSR